MISRRHGKRLGQRETRTGTGTWAPGVVAAADPGGDGRSPGDGERVPEGGGDRDPGTGSLGPPAPKTGLHEKACRVNSLVVPACSTAVAGASSDLSFDLPPGFHSHSSRVRFLGPVHDEVRGVRALQSIDRPRRSAAFTQSPGQGGLGIERSVTRTRWRQLGCLLWVLGCPGRSFYAAWPCRSL